MGDTRKTIGIIGFGNMGSSIAEQLKSDYQICVFDADELKTKDLKGSIKVVLGTALVVQDNEVIILAVKPQDFGTLLALIKKPSAATDRLYISIAAGITTGYIEKTLNNARVIRAMPNILLKMGLGVTCLSKGKFATEQDMKFAQGLFGSMGEVLTIQEAMMNAATAVSGSGPAYICHYIQSGLIEEEVFLADFIKAAEGAGFSRQEAAFLANSTFRGTVNFIKKTNISALELKKQVTSKGGTTEAALEILRKGGSLQEAVMQAKKRAEELSKKG